MRAASREPVQIISSSFPSEMGELGLKAEIEGSVYDEGTTFLERSPEDGQGEAEGKGDGSRLQD